MRRKTGLVGVQASPVFLLAMKSRAHGVLERLNPGLQRREMQTVVRTRKSFSPSDRLAKESHKRSLGRDTLPG